MAARSVREVEPLGEPLQRSRRRDIDRLGERSTAPDVWQGSIAETTLRVAATDPGQTEALVAVLKRFFAVRETWSADWPAIRLVLACFAPQLSPDGSGEQLPSAPPLRVWRTAHGFHFRLEGAAFQVDEPTGRAIGTLPDDFWAWPALRQRGLLLVVLLAQLAAHRRYGLHANAVDGDEGGVLIVGDSGSGKTTLTLSLVSRGWRYVSDDAVALRDDAGNGVEALAVRRSLSCGPATVQHLPELRARAGPESVQADGKCLIDVDKVYPGRSVSGCRPRSIVFPEIGAGNRSSVEAIGDREAMLQLLAQTSIGTTDPNRAAAQLDLLRRLLQQARCWRLRLGSDVHADRDAVSTLLHRAAAGRVGSAPEHVGIA